MIPHVSTHHASFGRWSISCTPDDGGRVTSLRFGDIDLLTPPPRDFRPPRVDHGLYETRPVFGYDDCFPTVDACEWPAGGWQIPDHGELCWRPWRMGLEPDCAVFTVRSERLPMRFTRRMRFHPHRLDWEFEVVNDGDVPLSFLHVMHGLMPLADVTAVELPSCRALVDEVTGQPCPDAEAGALVAAWITNPPPTARMLLLRGVAEGRCRITLQDRLRLAIGWPVDLFPTLGIWWNPGCYPDEEGCRRTECAFEPIPGQWSSLEASHKAGASLTAPPRGHLRWCIHWQIEH